MTETKLTVVPTIVGEATGSFEDVRSMVLDARRRTEDSYWDFSVLLHEVYTNSYYMDWGFKSWADYIEAELDIQKRKAQYLVSIQEWFGRMNPSIQQWIKELGWTKAKELVGIITPDNADRWKAKLDGLSYAQMMEVLKGRDEDNVLHLDDSEIGDGAGSGSNSDSDEKAQKKTFHLFPDQLSNVDRAIDVAKSFAGSDKDGHALDMICLDFLSTNGEIKILGDYLAKVEKVSGIKIIAYDPKDDAIVFGDDTLNSLVDSD